MLLSWLVLALAVWITAQVLPGIEVKGFWGAVVAAALFGVLNWLLGWLLFVVIGLATLGIGFLLAVVTRCLVDAILLSMIGALTSRVKVKSFGWALAGALSMALLGTAAEAALARIL